MKLLFVTDLHGGNRVFRKSLDLFRRTEANFLLVGGDVGGKYLVPVVGDEENATVEVEGRFQRLTSPKAVREYIDAIAEMGGYAIVCLQEEADRLRSDLEYREELLRRERIARLKVWLGEVQVVQDPQSFLLNLGNDDPAYLDDVVEEGTVHGLLENRNIDMGDGLRLISCGFTNPTPWACPRDCSEGELESRLRRKFGDLSETDYVIANLHCPPFRSRLDRAPRLDGQLRPIIGIDGVEYTHVGSVAVRSAIEQYSPLLSLHGHVHEAYAKDQIGNTIAVNPGSSYQTGHIRAALVHLAGVKIRGVQLVQER